MPSPILVTGSHRSGSTWIGKLLTAAPRTFYVHEPFNVDARPTWLNAPVNHWYEFLPDGDPRWDQLDRTVRLKFPLAYNLRHGVSWSIRGKAVQQAFVAAAARTCSKTVVVKDPFMLFNAPSFQKRYDAKVVLTVRRPGAFVSSLLRLNWRFDFGTLADQKALMEAELQPWAGDVYAAADQQLSPLHEAALLWRVLHGYIVNALEAQGNDFIVVHHEDFSSNVRNNVAFLFDRLGLEMTPSARDRVDALSLGSREVTPSDAMDVRRDSRLAAHAWEARLTPEQIAEIELACAAESARLYPAR